MRAAIPLTVLLFAAVTANAGLSDVRRLLQQNETAGAVAELEEMLDKKPDDPWLLYNRAVVAYATGDFGKADEIWQRLAGWQLPEGLREQVWTQIGNVSFRLAEPAIAKNSDTAVARLEQSREAYRVVLSQKGDHEVAQKNLRFVEQQMELLYVRLAQRLVDDARQDASADQAIEKLHGALDYQRNATALNPIKPEHLEAERNISGLIADRLSGRAGDFQKRADRITEQKSMDQWTREAAKENYERALSDFREAQSFAPEKPEAKDGEQRVIDKLSGMFVKAGREQQKDGDKQAKNQPREAFDHYEEALHLFDQALAVKAGHSDAAAGKKEVLDAMEQLHLREGDKLAKSGEQQLGKDLSEAAEKLLGALDHFEQARAINPDNPEIPPRIDHVQKLLPDALVAMGQDEQKHAEKAEPNSIRKAVAHLEQAESGFDKAQQLEPENEPARRGLEEVREDLARLRKELAQQADQQEQQSQQKKDPNQPSYAAMLARVKAQQQERDADSRKQRRARYEEQKNNLRNW